MSFVFVIPLICFAISIWYFLVSRTVFGVMLSVFNITLVGAALLLMLDTPMMIHYLGGYYSENTHYLLLCSCIVSLPFLFVKNISLKPDMYIPPLAEFSVSGRDIYVLISIFKYIVGLSLIVGLVVSSQSWLSSYLTSGGGGGSPLMEYGVTLYSVLAIITYDRLGKKIDVLTAFVAIVMVLYGERMLFLMLVLLVLYFKFQGCSLSKKYVLLSLPILSLFLFVLGVLRWGLESSAGLLNWEGLSERLLDANLSGIAVSSIVVDEYVSGLDIVEQLGYILMYLVPLPGGVLEIIAYDPFRLISNNITIPGGGMFFSYFGFFSYVACFLVSLWLSIIDRRVRCFEIYHVIFLLLSFRILYYSPGAFSRQVVFCFLLVGFFYLIGLIVRRQHV